jgi:hypothetical protein
MTKAAKAFGKDLSNFMRSPETLEYLEALSVNFTDKEIVKVQRGNGLLPNVGTWGHPKLAVFFARWLDARFAVFCDTVIDDILNKKAEVTFTAQANAPKLAKTHLDTARELVAALEATERLKAEKAQLPQENAVLLPKAESHDAFISTDGL